MYRIFKYEFELTDYQHVDIPKGAKVLKVDKQGQKYCFWALVNTDAKFERKTLAIFGTGNPTEIYDDNLQMFNHWGTFFDGPFVWHVFEVSTNG